MNPTPFDDLSEHTAAIQRIANALCGSGPNADDVGQEMWLAAHTSGGSGPVAWGPWFSGTGRRILWARRRSEARRRIREQRAARNESLPSAQERAIRIETEERLLKIVRGLPEAQSEVVYLRFWEALPPREIAKRLGVSVEAVKTRQKRALVALRQRLSDETPGGRDVWMGALAGLPLVPLPSAGFASTSLSYLGVLMTMKHLAIVLALSVIGIGWWFIRPASEASSNFNTTAVVAEATLIGLEGSPSLAAKPIASERAPAGDPVVPESHTNPKPDEKLVITGRLWNVPTGGDRAAATPAVGAEVRLSWFMAGMPGDIVPTYITDESGAFRLEQNTADYHAQISVDVLPDKAYAHATEQLKWKKGSVEPLEVDVYRIAHGSLEGLVVDRSGGAIVGAKMVFMANEEPVRESVSDTHGRFVFPQSALYGHVQGELPGWTTLESPEVKKDELGKWEAVRVVMCETGALGIRIETDEGEPLPGIKLSLGLSPSENIGRGYVGAGYRTLLWGETNAKGHANFSAVWADLNLRLSSALQGLDFKIERERGGFLLIAGSAGVGHPIALQAKSNRQLTLRTQPVRSIKCRVVGPGGDPISNAFVRLASKRMALDSPETVRYSTTTDEEGRCEIRIISSLSLGPAVLTASDLRASQMPWYSKSLPMASSRLLHLDQLPEEELTLMLEPTLAITGRLVEGEGGPLRGRVRVKPVDSELIAGRLRTGFSPQIYTSGLGKFVIVGLTAGRYEIVATHSLFSSDAMHLNRVVVNNVQAGTEDLVIRIESPPAAHIEVLLDTGGVPMNQFETLVGWHAPAEGSAPQIPLLPRNGSYSDPLGWPENMSQWWYGSGAAHGRTAQNRFMVGNSKNAHKELRLAPGSYWIGARGRAVDGTPFAQMGTGLVQIAEGDYRVTFKMRPCVELSGRVLGAGAVSDLALALALPGGELLPMDIGRNSIHSIIELGAMGDFHLVRVPAGKYELRIGTRAALELGGASVTRAIELVHGEALKLEIDL